MNHNNPHHLPDPYELEPPIQHLQPHLTQKLVQDAQTYAQAIHELQSQPFFSSNNYFIVSAKWLKRWKKYVSYDEVTSSQPPSKLLGCGQLPLMNEDITQNNECSSYVSSLLPQKMKHLSVKLKSNLAQHRDYQFINQQAWDVLNDYPNIQIQRYVVDTPDGQKVQLYYPSITIVPLWNSLLKDVENQRISKLTQLNIQYSAHTTISQIIQDYGQIFGKFAKKQCYGSYFPQNDFVRLWLMPQNTRKSILYNTLQQGCKANPSFTYKLYLQGQLIPTQTLIREVDLLPQTIVVAQLRQQGQKWMFFNLKHKLQAPCSYCKKVSLLNYVCSCRHAVYCSKDCKQLDKGHHRYRCPNEAQSDQQQKELVLNYNSKKGLAGLRNLGNTCFMNSGLQCLSHIKQLTQYFLSNKYLKDINRTNPLGTQGQLSTQYGKMIKNLWLGEQNSFSPTHLKKSIAKFQPMFSGYNQHDSGQLITYLLDGLHQDLNRVIDKPYTQIKDYDGRPDHIIARQSWQTYLKRNKSVIVDLMYGQFKSVVQCPNQNCQFLSITFDPFSVCSLPLVDNSRKTIEIVVLNKHIQSKKIQFSYSLDKQYTLQQKTAQLKQLLNLEQNSRIIAYIASYTSCEPINSRQPIDDIRKQYKYRTIFIRQLQPFQNPDKDIKVMLGHVISNHYYSDQSYRKNLLPFQLLYLNTNITNKQVYTLIIQRYRTIMDKLQLPLQTDELINCLDQQEEPIRLLLITSSRYFSCSYCKKKNCSGCKLPYNDELFRQYIDYNPQSEYSKDKRIEMEFYWRKNQKQVQKIFDQLGQQTDNNKYAAGHSYKPPNIKIQECIEMFSRQQILGQDNLWYCPKCTDFVAAKKQMRIYKAPKILIFCLKRFKRKQYFSQKISAMVDFPVQGFDLNQFVCNPLLPNQTELDGKMDIEGSLVYDLIGISNHFGSTGGGHYTAYCKDPISKEWYDFDDSSVSKLNGPQDVISQSAYILFYQRRL